MFSSIYEKKIIHPFLFSIFPSLAFVAHNIDELDIEVISLSLLLFVVAILLLWFVINLFLKNARRSAIISSTIYILFSSFNHLLNIRFNINNSIYNFFPDSLFVLLAILILLAIHLIKKLQGETIKTISTILNIISFSIIVLPAGIILSQQASRIFHTTGVEDLETVNFKLNTNSGNINQLRDIYYIIPDRYASSYTLKNYYGYDNSDFESFLIEKGFYIAHQSHANYPFTPSSLASSLNMNYLDELVREMGADATDKTPFYHLIEDNSVQRYLKSKGYKFVNVGSSWDVTASFQNADVNYVTPSLQPKDGATLFAQFQPSIINPLIHNINSIFKTRIPKLGDRRNGWIDSLEQFNNMTKASSIDSPKFILMHSLITHPPYVFNKDGTFILSRETGQRTPQQLYLDQLTYANQALEELIEIILNNSKQKPIIIIQSDEGPYPEQFIVNFSAYKWKNASKEELEEKMGIFNAYYFPDVENNKLYSQITPVNSFRLVFNLYFGEKFPLLQDKNFMQIDGQHMYDLFDITKQLKQY